MIFLAGMMAKSTFAVLLKFSHNLLRLTQLNVASTVKCKNINTGNETP
jgi:hypothetical protein